MPAARPGAEATAARSATRGSRRRTSHSLEAVLTEAVALLDEAGEPALTFRALAARLGGGVASIYWYVASKEELLDRATDQVLVGVLEDTQRFADPEGRSADPVDDVRAIAVILFDAIVQRPWLASYFMRNTTLQPHALELYERLGQQVLRLGLTPRQSFHAVSAVVGFVVGIAADLGQEPPEEVLKEITSREEFMSRYAAQWRALDAEAYPFVHHIVDEFEGHDDVDQFRAGLELMLAGLRLQADA